MTDPGSDKEACPPVWGCVLIGGASSRMGRPKHLIEQDGKTWLEIAVSNLAGRLERVVISGKGRIPAALAGITVIEDDPGLRGPLAGILSVMRWQPRISWIVTGCDQPAIKAEAIDWLLALRNREVRAILPDLHGDGHIEPLLAFYDCRCKEYLEEIAARQTFRISEMKGRSGIITPCPPAALHGSWRNINSPEEMV